MFSSSIGQPRRLAENTLRSVGSRGTQRIRDVCHGTDSGDDDVGRRMQVLIGRGAILHHDYPARALADPTGFRPIATPVSAAHLLAEGLSPTFGKPQ